MTRTVSQRFKDLIFAQHGDDAVEALVTVTHPTIDDVFRFTSGHPNLTRLSDNPLRYGTVSRGNIYDFVPFDLTLPGDDADKPPEMQIVMGNVGRELIPLLRSTQISALFLIELVVASYPDDVEVSFPVFRLASATYDAQNVTMNLVVDGLANETWPADTFSPSRFPGLF